VNESWVICHVTTNYGVDILVQTYAGECVLANSQPARQTDIATGDGYGMMAQGRIAIPPSGGDNKNKD
jgi:hypothetical protein